MNPEDTKSIVQDGSHSLSTGDADSDSPCIGVCTTLYDEICQGCGRTLGEVSNWVFFSQEEKESVWKRIRAEGTATRFQRQAKENKPS
ncbi:MULTISPECIES: DUF1289 domain-containing protein [unclassified Polynucleobacter]|uniref:DUF1289 domain-containing protein n=1 Tax=unclassified Polynucleobacter TaxID=2640945 RepID=UPI001C20C878|nr:MULTISPECIES: DUF1289 domain-containing protein [unclassified Polynucleobacter]MBU3549196.1 DUF1289 domain-containing protein [Polynucleobacter sp. P1-05-14]MBU3639079.1 DUF1289 domain-containing protein [Polynucleobacter sp. AP-RePozz3-80-G7]